MNTTPWMLPENKKQQIEALFAELGEPVKQIIGGLVTMGGLGLLFYFAATEKPLLYLWIAVGVSVSGALLWLVSLMLNHRRELQRIMDARNTYETLFPKGTPERASADKFLADHQSVGAAKLRRALARPPDAETHIWRWFGLIMLVIALLSYYGAGWWLVMQVKKALSFNNCLQVAALTSTITTYYPARITPYPKKITPWAAECQAFSAAEEQFTAQHWQAAYDKFGQFVSLYPYDPYSTVSSLTDVAREKMDTSLLNLAREQSQAGQHEAVLHTYMLMTDTTRQKLIADILPQVCEQGQGVTSGAVGMSNHRRAAVFSLPTNLKTFPPELLAANPGELFYAACLKETKQTVETCAYGKPGEATLFTYFHVIREQVVWEISLREVRSGKIIDSATFQGSLPDACPDQRGFTFKQTTYRFTGAPPTVDDLAGWLKPKMK